MWYWEVCKNDVNLITKSSHIKSDTKTENGLVSRINNNPTDKTNTYNNPKFNKIVVLVEELWMIVQTSSTDSNFYVYLS